VYIEMYMTATGLTNVALVSRLAAPLFAVYFFLQFREVTWATETSVVVRSERTPEVPARDYHSANPTALHSIYLA
jgi:hypothetical protein